MVNTTKECKFEDCTLPSRTRDMCVNHYAQWYRTQPRKNPPKVVTEKYCPICEVVKPASEYYTHKSGYNAGRLQTYCKDCHGKKMRALRFESAAVKKKASPPRTYVTDMDCSFGPCPKKAKTHYKGEGPYCNAHYWQLSQGKELSIITPKGSSKIDGVVRRCTGCDRIKPEESFYKRSNKLAVTRCKPCARLISTFGNRLRSGAVQEALSVAQSMPLPMRNKYVAIATTLLNGEEESLDV